MNRDSMNVGRCSRTLLAACAGLGWAAFAGPSWAQGVDDLGAPKQTPNYVTDDMLLKRRQGFKQLVALWARLFDDSLCAHPTDRPEQRQQIGAEVAIIIWRPRRSG
jgi:hypothetical protein